MKITRLYMASLASDIMRISANGGTPESIVKLKSGSLSRSPNPAGWKVDAVYVAAHGTAAKIMVQSLKSGETKELFSGVDAQYVPTGHIIYMLPNNSNLFAVPFDLARLEVKGDLFRYSKA